MKTGRKQFGFYADEQAIIEVIKLKKRLRKGGCVPGPYVIARELNNEGYKSPAGKAWSGQTVSNIIRRFEKVTEPKKKYRKKTQLESTDYMTPEEIDKCRAAIRPDEVVLFETMLGTGLRAFEIRNLKIRDAGISGGKKQLDVRRGKRNKGRSVQIGSKLAEMLEKHIENTSKNHAAMDSLFYNRRGKPISYKDIYNFVKRIAERTGIKWLTPHKMRHTFATILYNYKHDLIFVQKQLGHASVQTTQIYADTIITTKDSPMDGFEKIIECNRL